MGHMGESKAFTAGDRYQWMIKLQGTVHHGPNFFALGGYYYHMSDVNCRLLLRLVKPYDELEIVKLYADSDTVLGMFCHLNGLDHGMVQFTPHISNVRLAEPTCYEPLYSDGTTYDVRIRSLPVTGPITISGPPLESNYHTGLENQRITAVGSTETNLTLWSTISSGGETQPEARTVESIVMAVPQLNETQDDIRAFVKGFVQGLNKGVRRVACSLCHGEKRKKLWDVKPSNLARHLFAHFRIKGFPCATCDRKFTTKHQLKLHSIKHHPSAA